MRLSLVLVIVNGCGFTPGVLAVVLPGDAADSDTTLVDAEVDARKFDACATCPANDVSGGPEQITGTIVLTADLTNAHDDIAVSCGGAGGRDLFYELVVPTQQVVYVDTSTSTADTALALYAGPCAMEPAAWAPAFRPVVR